MAKSASAFAGPDPEVDGKFLSWTNNLGSRSVHLFDKPNLLTPQQVANRLGVSTTTLSTWRCTKRYPLPYVKVGRLVRYRVADVEAFETGRLQAGGRQ